MKAVFISLFAAIIFLACLNEPQLPPLTNDYLLGDIVPLALHQEASISQENIHIAFSKIRDESRCPETWECLWGGEAEIDLIVKKGEYSETCSFKILMVEIVQNVVMKSVLLVTK